MTPAEAILWRELRGRRFDGVKFRRQQPVGSYIADFLCPGLKVIVELDGESHLGREVEDRTRQVDLERMGFHVLRFSNTDIYDDLSTVMENLWLIVDRRRLGASPHPSPPSPLPQGERGDRG
jgi:very-short-patch-repair endonuclease